MVVIEINVYGGKKATIYLNKAPFFPLLTLPPTPPRSPPHPDSGAGTSSKRYLSTFCDGASRTTPFQAGAGAVLYWNFEEIATNTDTIPLATSNQGEYRSNILAVILAIEFNQLNYPHSCYFHGDSSLIILLLQTGHYPSHPDLLPLHLLLLQHIKIFTNHPIKQVKAFFIHVKRHLNKRSDAMANGSSISLAAAAAT